MREWRLNEKHTIGHFNGVDFDVIFYPVNGFRLILTESKTGETLFDGQMILKTLCDAVYSACQKVFEHEIESKKLWELPSLALIELGLDGYCEIDD